MALGKQLALRRVCVGINHRHDDGPQPIAFGADTDARRWNLVGLFGWTGHLRNLAQGL